MPHRSPGPHYVYRVYDSTGALIYVGCTKNLFARLQIHQGNAWWAPQAAKVVARVFPTQSDALAVEKRAIKSEHPKWNIGMRDWKNNRDWTRQNYVDYVTAWVNGHHSFRRTPVENPHNTDHMKSVARAYWIRFGEELPMPVHRSAAKNSA